MKLQIDKAEQNSCILWYEMHFDPTLFFIGIFSKVPGPDRYLAGAFQF